MDNLFKDIVKNSGWVFFSQTASQIVGFISIIFLARLLLPEDFGLISMTNVITTLAYIFSGLGLGTTIIQRKYVDNLYISTAFWATLITGIFIFLFLVIISPIASSFFKEPRLKKIIIYSGFAFIFASCSAVHRAILRKKLNFKVISLIDLTSSIFSSILAVILAFLGFGVWSLVARGIAYEAIKVPFFWKYSKWKPSFAFHKESFKDLFGFSSYVLGSNFINYFDRNADNIIIGRFLGATLLGFYSLAYNIMLKPLQFISYAINNALYPALSKIQDNKELSKETYLKTIKMITYITFPMMGGLFVIAPEAIKVIYGPKWTPSIPILQILCFIGALQSIAATLGSIYLSQGRSQLMFKITIFTSPFLWLAFIIGIRWGIVGVAVSYAIFYTLVWLISQSVANRLINLDIKTFLKNIKYPILYTLLMMLAVFFTKICIKHSIHTHQEVITLVSSIATGVFIYVLVILKSNDKDIANARYFLIKRYTCKSQS